MKDGWKAYVYEGVALLILFLIVILPGFLTWYQVLPVVILVAGYSYLLRRIAVKENSALIYHAGMVALLIKIVLVLIYHGVSLYTGKDGFFFYDDRSYHHQALAIAAAFRRREIPSPIDPYYTGSYHFGYQYFIALVYVIFGPAPLLVKLCNPFFASLAALAGYYVARSLFYHRVALISYLLLQFYPEFMVWSTAMLKDILLMLLVVVIMCLFLKIAGELLEKKVPRVGLILSFIVILSFIFISRGYSALLLVTAFLLHILRNIPPSSQQKWIRNAAVAAAVLVVIVLTVPSLSGVLPLLKEYLQAYTYDLHKLSFAGIVDGSVPLFVFSLSKSFFLNLFSPFPWNFHGIDFFLVTLYPGMVLWYFLFPLLVKGVSETWNDKRRAVLIYFPAMMFLLYSFMYFEGAIRQRLQYLPFLLILAVYGLSVFEHEKDLKLIKYGYLLIFALFVGNLVEKGLNLL